MLQQISPKTALIALLSVLTAATTGAVKEGDPCGIDGADFMDDNFGGTNAVAGPGCTLSDGGTNCYCASIKDADPFGEWVWQCNSTPDAPAVEFGPVEGKTCPEAIPVPKDYDYVQPTCDTALHPTGLVGDPSCPYHDCDVGGDTSAVCGCVDMAAYGIGEGMQWFCLHSTCSSDDDYCGTEAPDGTTALGPTAAPSSAPTPASSPPPSSARTASATILPLSLTLGVAVVAIF